jgi:hypothetical protein
MFGTYNAKLWKLVFNPFIVASSGRPFNITTGFDSNLDRQFTDRPSFAATGANCSSPFIKCTRFGNFNLLPTPGEQIIPRNFGQGPGSFSLNLRVSRTFGFGDVHKAAAAPGQSGQTTASASNKRPAGGAGSRGPTIPGGGGGEGHGPGGGGAGMGMGGFGGGGSSEKKYTLNVGVFFQNILNNVNLGSPVGNLSSPFFGQSQSVAGSFGGFGGGGGGSPNAGNRKISLSLRFNF